MGTRTLSHVMQSYRARSAQWLKLFQTKTLEFVGEIQIDPDELEELCLALNRDWNHRYREEFTAALAVATVNLAYFSSREFQTNHFPQYVLEKLHWQQQGQTFWENEIGSPVISLLEKYFQSVRRTGPGRYAIPIKEQAGVPASVEPQFLKLFCSLIHQHGFHFREEAYESFLEHNHSPVLESFLNTETGRRFCRDLARILKNRLAGVDYQNAFPDQPRFKSLLDKAWEYLQTKKNEFVERLPHPKLILDLDSRQLAIAFSERGLNGEYEWHDDDVMQVRRSLYFLQDRDLKQRVIGWVKQPNSLKEQWSLQVWQPRETPWAAFRTGDHSYLGQQKTLSSGHYWLILPDDLTLASPAEVLGEYGWLRSPSGFKIYDCFLPPGFAISEIGLQVESSINASPDISFQPSRSLPSTNQVFAGKLPELQVRGWSEEIAPRFFLLMDSDSQKQSVPLSAPKLQLSPPLPSQGEIRLEPTGRTPRNFIPQKLRYTLLPTDVKIIWPSGLLNPTEEAVIQVHPANHFKLLWEDDRIKEIRPGCFRVPPTSEFVEGQALYQSNISFPIYGAIHRLKVIGPAIKNGIFWRENFTTKSHLEIRLSPDMAGQQIELGLLEDGGLKRGVQLTEYVPRSGTLSISTEQFRDAFAGSSFIAATIGIRVFSPYPGRTIQTGIVYINEEKLIASLHLGGGNIIEPQVNILPKVLQDVVRSIHKLSIGPVSKFKLDLTGLPKTLQNFITCLQACHQVMDCQGNGDEWSGFLDKSLQELLRWFSAVERILVSKPSFASQELINLRSNIPEDISGLPFTRWREAFQSLQQQLLARKDWPTAVREWGQNCQRTAWQQAEATQIGQLRGGSLLTEGAKNYYYALERIYTRKPPSEIMSFLKAARNKFEQAQQQAGQEITGEIASALRLMTFYHAEHQAFRTEVQSYAPQLPSQWSKLAHTLLHLQKAKKTTPPTHLNTLGLSDISPHFLDIEMEQSINE